MRYVWTIVKMQLGRPRMVGVYADWARCHAELVRLGQGSVIGTGPDREPDRDCLSLPALPSEPGEDVYAFREPVAPSEFDLEDMAFRDSYEGHVHD